MDDLDAEFGTFGEDMIWNIMEDDCYTFSYKMKAMIYMMKMLKREMRINEMLVTELRVKKKKKGKKV